jgi:methylated-DNA-[protein]-cysteine S-methyltransferase
MTTFTALDIPAVIGSSRWGWYGVAGDESAVRLVTIGHASEAEVEQRLRHEQRGAEWTRSPLVTDAADEIGRYLDGEPIDLSRIPVVYGAHTPFQNQVVTALRRVHYGRTVTYGELAELAGAPSAARAVGTVMSRNPVPLLIPCHRVVGAGGALGGFSAPQGTQLKRALLAMEAGENKSLADDANES